jgi:hypothetical protein
MLSSNRSAQRCAPVLPSISCALGADQMRRREFITLVCGAAVGRPFVAIGQRHHRSNARYHVFGDKKTGMSNIARGPGKREH